MSKNLDAFLEQLTAVGPLPPLMKASKAAEAKLAVPPKLVGVDNSTGESTAAAVVQSTAVLGKKVTYTQATLDKLLLKKVMNSVTNPVPVYDEKLGPTYIMHHNGEVEKVVDQPETVVAPTNNNDSPSEWAAAKNEPLDLWYANWEAGVGFNFSGMAFPRKPAKVVLSWAGKDWVCDSCGVWMTRSHPVAMPLLWVGVDKPFRHLGCWLRGLTSENHPPQYRHMLHTLITKADEITSLLLFWEGQTLPIDVACMHGAKEAKQHRWGCACATAPWTNLN